MPVTRMIAENDGGHFINYVCIMAAIFKITNGYDIVYNWFKRLIHLKGVSIVLRPFDH